MIMKMFGTNLQTFTCKLGKLFTPFNYLISKNSYGNLFENCLNLVSCENKVD